MISIPHIRGASTNNNVPSAIRAMSAAERQQVADVINRVNAEELRDTMQARRLEKIQAAFNDPRKAPAIRACVGELRRVGLTLSAAADMSIADLDEKLAKANASLEQRMQIKTMLRRIGIL